MHDEWAISGDTAEHYAFDAVFLSNGWNEFLIFSRQLAAPARSP